MAKQDAVVLLSGGIDSTVLLYQMVFEGYKCYPISFDYGQRHRKEIIAARNVCEARDHNLLLRHKLVNLSTALNGLLPSALTGVGEIPKGYYAEESMKQTVVPGRNLIFLAIAAGYAEGIGAEVLAYAAHSGDHYIYPDCRPLFARYTKFTIEASTDDKLTLYTPFLNIRKSNIVRIGRKLNVPFKKTWSCYKGGDIHCGVCGTCVERREAFAVAKVEDPTEYEV